MRFEKTESVDNIENKESKIEAEDWKDSIESSMKENTDGSKEESSEKESLRERLQSLFDKSEKLNGNKESSEQDDNEYGGEEKENLRDRLKNFFENKLGGKSEMQESEPEKKRNSFEEERQEFLDRIKVDLSKSPNAETSENKTEGSDESEEGSLLQGMQHERTVEKSKNEEDEPER